MKAIDFDPVADLYDSYVQTDADHVFWQTRVCACPRPALELMCGTGRITLAMLQAGLEVEGLDYSRGLLECFRHKLHAHGLATELHEADARSFALARRYGLIYIGFNAIAEVIENEDKRKVFARVREHLIEGGELWLTIHNPPIRQRTLDGREQLLGTDLRLSTGERLDAHAQFFFDPQTNLVTGEQRFVARRNGAETRRIVQSVSFHLISPPELEQLLTASGFEIRQRFGNYDGSAFVPETSPFCILGCTVVR